MLIFAAGLVDLDLNIPNGIKDTAAMPAAASPVNLKNFFLLNFSGDVPEPLFVL